MRLVCLLLLPSLAACASLPEPHPVEFFDEQSAVTLTVVDAPWLLARERRDIAANARDYLTLVAAERNQAGQYTLALVVHNWSTIDARVNDDLAPESAPLVLVADGRDFRPARLATLPREFAGRSGRLWEPDVSRYATLAFAIDAATLRFLASSIDVYAYFDAPGGAAPYREWRDGRAPMLRLIDAARR
jgi:hypothetical protein